MTATPLTVRPRDVDPAQLARISDEFELAPPTRIIAWAYDFHGGGLTLTASFQDCVLVDLATKVVPDIEVVFLDTQYHFAETLWYVDEVRRRYDLNLTVVRPRVAPDNRWQADVDACCGARKVEPLNRALAGKTAWMTGLRRDESPRRAATPIVSWDASRGLVKVNPLATWTHADVDGYERDHSLPPHPLKARGYPSIGCWPCTDPVAPGDDPRAGRWAGSDKVECGIHA